MKDLWGKIAIALAILAATALTLVAAAWGAQPVSVSTGNIELRVNGGFVPTRGPESAPGPATRAISTSVRTVDGSQPPALEQLTYELDRNSAIDVRGLPVCHPKVQYQAT